jgi:hypothetical protein
MQSSTRELYLNVLRSNKGKMMEYGAFFANESAGNPNETLTASVDTAFSSLVDLCDLPQYAQTLPEMDSGSMMRHATGTSSKYSFVFEFLREIEELDIRVLLLAKPGLVLSYLDAILANSKFKYCHLRDSTGLSKNSEEFTVILGSSTDDLSGMRTPVDVVILFDHTARAISIASLRASGNSLVVVTLALTCSIEHIDIDSRLPHSLDEFERRNAMCLALAASQSLISRDKSVMPHQTAAQVARFIRNPDGRLPWDPQPLPDQLFDFYANSHTTSRDTQGFIPGVRQNGIRSALNSRKRLLVSVVVTVDGAINWKGSQLTRQQDDVEENVAKRLKTTRDAVTSIYHAPQRMSDLLKATLESYSPRENGSPGTRLVLVDQLEWMAAKVKLYSCAKLYCILLTSPLDCKVH